jgi:hypothetical protein
LADKISEYFYVVPNTASLFLTYVGPPEKYTIY